MSDPTPTPTMSGVYVPREPTREMWAAGGNAVVGKTTVHHDLVVEAVWTAMLAAVPSSDALAAAEARGIAEGLERTVSWLETAINTHAAGARDQALPQLLTDYHAAKVVAHVDALNFVRNLPAVQPETTPPYQFRVTAWLMECFGPEITLDPTERVHRFWEEALELGQSAGCTASEAHQLVDYVFGRPIGELGQEIGGTLVCLAALCAVHGIDMGAEGERELARIWTKVDKIRAKHAAKPKFSPLPGSAPDAEQKAGEPVTPMSDLLTLAQVAADLDRHPKTVLSDEDPL